ncbi:hypothetical protein F503_07607 [Ophiostoma piceae UAMH 11346]|uniref:HNH nuclease domain-containing protein n=1 Tax=Ophiostoma piceae (strain UAMH 11346) TaxID=1262450 RepID=S3CCU8_OPHP1|nr:hypothetical protein F503_07607 [Ophiostoma piceae UAMH 11346]
MEPPTIISTALTNESLDWLPTGRKIATDLEPELERRRQLFVEYIEQVLDNLDNDDNDDEYDPVSTLYIRQEHHAALVVANNPTLAGFFLGPLGDDDRNLDYSNLLGGSDSNKNAQSTVRGWYSNQCVITGADLTEGAHIVPIRVISTREQVHLESIRSALSCVWPIDRLADLSYRGREPNNILPLARGAHGRWDNFQFYLRPIPDPFVWTDDELIVGTPRGDAILADVTNGRRPIDVVAYPPVRTGDVFLLETVDPIKYPLPSLESLQIQAGVHRLLGGLRAAATLASLFGRPPPDDDDGNDDGNDNATALGALEDNDLPHLWGVLLEAAVAKHILRLDDAGRWARTLIAISSNSMASHTRPRVPPC